MTSTKSRLFWSRALLDRQRIGYNGSDDVKCVTMSCDPSDDRRCKGRGQPCSEKYATGSEGHKNSITRKHRRCQIHNINIATWNIQTLLQAGKLMNITMETKRLEIDILGIAEIRWTGNGRFCVNENYEFLYSGGCTQIRGVDILIKKELAKLINNVLAISDRVISIRLNIKPKPLVIIQVYAPTEDSTDEEIENFYEQISEALKATKHGDIVIVLGDFNAKISQDNRSSAAGKYCLGKGNARGDRLLEFADKHSFKICNTWFKNHKRRLYTWLSPGGKYRNQIDFILINERYKNIVKKCHTYPGADGNTDHVLLMAKCKIKLKKIPEHNNTRSWDVQRLKDKEIREKFQDKLLQYDAVTTSESELESVESNWNHLKENIIEAANNSLPCKIKKSRNMWLNDEIADKMNQRRAVKDKTGTMYKKLNKEVIAVCRKAKVK